MGVLRDRMIRDMRLRRFSPRTEAAYVRSVERLAKHFHRSPDRIDEEKVRDYLYHLMSEQGLSWSSINVASAAIRFFYVETLGRLGFAAAIPPRRTPQRLPEILSKEELERLFTGVTNIKHRALLMAAVHPIGLRHDRRQGCSNFSVPWLVTLEATSRTMALHALLPRPAHSRLGTAPFRIPALPRPTPLPAGFARQQRPPQVHTSCDFFLPRSRNGSAANTIPIAHPDRASSPRSPPPFNQLLSAMLTHSG